MTATVTAAEGASTGGDRRGRRHDGRHRRSSPMADMTAQQMADMHKQGVEDFLAGNQTSTQGNQILKPKIENGVKVFNLTVSQIKWEVSKGVFKDAMAFNGMVPGPGDPRAAGRQGEVRGAEPDGPAVRAALPRADRAQRDGRRAVRDAGAGHAGRVLDLRVHDQGPAGDVRLPLPLQLHGAGGHGALRRADRRAAGRPVVLPDASRSTGTGTSRPGPRQDLRRVHDVPRRRSARAT